MASQAPNMLPLLYNGLEPLNRNLHGNFKVRRLTGLDRVATTHAIPVTVDEFAMVQRHFPIVFSVGDKPVPIALMGLHEGTNTFFDEKGVLRETNDLRAGLSAPLSRSCWRGCARTATNCRCASIRRRARSASSTKASRCSTATSRREATKAILQFCEQFEQAGQRTQAFMDELKQSGLLMDGEVAIQPEGAEQPFIYRGFQMVDEEKFREPARRRAAQAEPERRACR